MKMGVKIPMFFEKKDDSVEIGMAEICARNSLAMLLAGANGAIGLRAGLPWFFQFWKRDETVSLPALARFEEAAAMKIFWRQLNGLAVDSADARTADWPGWLFFAGAGFLKNFKFNIGEAGLVSIRLEKEIEGLLKNNTKNNFAVNGVGKTWMDSLARAGAGVEIQALRLNMYDLAAELAEDKKQRNYYSGLKKNLLVAFRKSFFDGNRLADTFDPDKNEADFTVRPNIFLAEYLYPGLLKKDEWARCFEHALDELWLDWGGLATVGKSAPRFIGRDTGENSAAYHNGDSWFWVNNIAAIAMARIDKKRFKKYIEKIFAASKNDILWNAALGCASEISSAFEYEAVGCANQAWSAAIFLELLRERK